MQQRLLSLGIWAGTAVITIVFWALTALCALAWWDRDRRLSHTCTQWWAQTLLAMNPFWQLTVDRRTILDDSQPYLFVANHQSFADIIVVFHIKHQFKWVAKAGLFQIPFLGWSLSLARNIRLRRGSFRSIRRTMDEAQQWLARRISVVFFAEGSRSRTGALTPFKSGAFKLAIETRTPVVPLVITGTRYALPRGSWIFRHRVRGTLTILPPIDTASYTAADADRLKDRVFREIERVVLASVATVPAAAELVQ